MNPPEDKKIPSNSCSEKKLQSDYNYGEEEDRDYENFEDFEEDDNLSDMGTDEDYGYFE